MRDNINILITLLKQRIRMQLNSLKHQYITHQTSQLILKRVHVCSCSFETFCNESNFDWLNRLKFEIYLHDVFHV